MHPITLTFYYRHHLYNSHFLMEGMLKMTSNAQTTAGKHVTSSLACAHSQRYTKDSVLWLAQMIVVHYDVTQFPAFCRPKSFRTVRQTDSQYINCQCSMHHPSPATWRHSGRMYTRSPRQPCPRVLPPAQHASSSSSFSWSPSSSDCDILSAPNHGLSCA